MLPVRVGHRVAVEGHAPASRRHAVGGFDTAVLHGGHQRGKLHRRSGLHRGAEGVVVDLGVFGDAVVCRFRCAAEVRDGLDTAGLDFHQHDRPPRRPVELHLLLERPRGHVLQVEVDGGDEVHAGARLHDVVVGDRHPRPARDPALQLPPFDAGELLVPRFLDAHAVRVAVDAHRPPGKLAERLAAHVAAVEGEAGLVAAELDEGQAGDLFLVRIAHISGNEHVAASFPLAVEQQLAELLGCTFAQHRAQAEAQAVQTRLKLAPFQRFTPAVPPDFVHGNGRGEDVAVRGEDLAAGRGDVADAGDVVLACGHPAVVLGVLDPQDATEHAEPEEDKHPKHEPHAGRKFATAVHRCSSKMGGVVGMANPLAATRSSRVLCCNKVSYSARSVLYSADSSSSCRRVACFSRSVRSKW